MAGTKSTTSKDKGDGSGEIKEGDNQTFGKEEILKKSTWDEEGCGDSHEFTT